MIEALKASGLATEPYAKLRRPPTRPDYDRFFCSAPGERYGTNDIRTAVRTALEDAGAGYTLGFYAGDEPDGKFHRIRVRVQRKGADPRRRKSYIALADDPSDERQRTDEIRYLLHGPWTRRRSVSTSARS